MFEKLKTLIRPPAPAGVPEHVHNLNAAARTGLAMDVRYLLRHVVHANEFPYLTQLGQSAKRDFSRIHIPLKTLPKLAREIEAIRHKLPAQSPLLRLAETAGKCRGMDLVIARGDEEATATTPSSVSTSMDNAAPPALSALEQTRMLKVAAAEVDVAYVSTAELGEPAQAAYYKYCLGLCDYDKIIDDLHPRVAVEPRVWVWSLLVAAMRLSNHAEFSATVARFHAWLEERHPETLNDMTASDDRRKFNGEKIAALELQELAPR